MSTTVHFAIGDIELEWDPAKESSNRRKHGVSFREAATVFLDPLARTFDDPVHSDGEHRFLLVGVSFAVRILLVVHVERGERLRILSARLANRKERANIETR
jgi:uncharacterized protein